MAQTPPNAGVPMVGPDGTATTSWFRFFSGLVGGAQAGSSVTPRASPYSYTATDTGTVLIRGGTVSAVTLTRGRLTVATGQTSGFFPVSQGDVLKITYTVAPTVTFLPR